MSILRYHSNKTRIITSKNIVSSIKGYNHYPYNFAIISTSKIMFISGEDGKLKSLVQSPKDYFLAGCFKPNNGRIFAVSNNDRKIFLIDFQKNSLLRTFKEHRGAVYSLSFSSNGIQMISGGDDKSLKIWDISLQKCLRSIIGHENCVRCVSYFPGHDQICASSSYDGNIQIYDLRCTSPISIKIKEDYPVEMFYFLSQGTNLISMGGNNLNLWCLSSKKKYFTMREEHPLVNMEIFSKNVILYSDLGNEIKGFDISNNQFFSVFCFKSEIVSMVSMSIGFVIGFSNGRVCFKKYFRKNIKLGKRLEAKKQRYFFDSKNFSVDFCSNFFYFPKKKNFIIKKKIFSIKLNDRDNHVHKKNLGLKFKKKMKSFIRLISNRRFNKLFNFLVRLNKPFIFFILLEEFKTKNILNKMLSKLNKKYIFFVFKLFLKKVKFSISFDIMFFFYLFLEIYSFGSKYMKYCVQFQNFFSYLIKNEINQEEKIIFQNYLDSIIIF